MRPLLVVCRGNICRSPMAEGALRARLEASHWAGWVTVDSAATGGRHASGLPDKRAIACARGHGGDIAGLRARQLRAAGFADFDGLPCADADNLRGMRAMVLRGNAHKTAFLLDRAADRDAGAQVPDRYYGGPEDCERGRQRIAAAGRPAVARLHGLQGRIAG